MGLIIKGTIPRVPPFSLWYLKPPPRILPRLVYSSPSAPNQVTRPHRFFSKKQASYFTNDLFKTHLKFKLMEVPISQASLFVYYKIYKFLLVVPGGALTMFWVSNNSLSPTKPSCLCRMTKVIILHDQMKLSRVVYVRRWITYLDVPDRKWTDQWLVPSGKLT